VIAYTESARDPLVRQAFAEEAQYLDLSRAQMD